MKKTKNRTAVRPLLVVSAGALALVLGACGGGDGAREEGIAELTDAGFGQAEAECIVDGVLDEVDSIDELESDDVSEETLEAAAAVFARCESAASADADTSEQSADEDESADDAATEEAAVSETAVPPTAEPPLSISIEGLAGEGHWSAEDLCLLSTTADVGATFVTDADVGSPVEIDEAISSRCLWEHPDAGADATLSTRLFQIVNTDRADFEIPDGALVEPVDLVGLGAADGAVYRAVDTSGEATIAIYLNDQLLEVSWPTEADGYQLAERIAQTWVAAQLGDGAVSAGSSGAEETTAPAVEEASPVPGLDAALDQLWVACAAGDPDSCDRLYFDSETGSVYEEFGFSCGDRGFDDCNTLLGDADGSYTPDTPPPGTDAALDSLWSSCGDGVADDCDELYFTSDIGSVYEFYGRSCGGRGYGSCADAIDRYVG